MEVTPQQAEENLLSLPKEVQTIATSAIKEMTDDELTSVLMVFGVTLNAANFEEGVETPLPEEGIPEEGISEEGIPEEAPPVEQASSEPVDEQMQQLALGDEVTGVIQKPNASTSGVADDVSMDANPGDFIINAATVQGFGESNLKKFLNPYVQSLQKEGTNVSPENLTNPKQKVKGNTDIQVSNGEYYIPEPLAQKVGYPKLEKINGIGAKRTEEKLAQQKANAPLGLSPGGRIPNGRKQKKRDDTIARILIGEAGGEGEKGMQAVLNVMGNRIGNIHGFRKQKDLWSVATALIPKSKKYQFNAFGNKDKMNEAHGHPRWEEAKDLVKEWRAKKLKDITMGATYFYNPEDSGDEGREFFEKNEDSGRFFNTEDIGKHRFFQDLGPNESYPYQLFDMDDE